MGDTYIHADHFEIQNVIQHRHLAEPILYAINRSLLEGVPLFDYEPYEALSDEPMSIYNPNGRVAFVLLYTLNIASYARIAEHNFKRYCDRHNYALYVYRDLPDEFKDKNIAGSWLKIWLLKEYLEQHEWIFWVDSDILVLNQAKPITDLLHNRDLLFAKDVAAWLINSGVMGFKNTSENGQLLQEMSNRIDAVEDKSGVYSTQGDQFHIIECLKHHDLLNERTMVDYLTINTPPMLKRPDSFMIHYSGEPSPLREIHMSHDDRALLKELISIPDIPLKPSIQKSFNQKWQHYRVFDLPNSVISLKDQVFQKR